MVISEFGSAWYLYKNQAPHPETGERMTLTHAILDSIGLLTVGVSKLGKELIVKHLKKLPAGTFDFDRPLLPVLVNLKLLRKLDNLHGAARMSHKNRIVREFQQRAIEPIDELVELATPGAAYVAGQTKRAAETVVDVGGDAFGQAVDAGKEAIDAGAAVAARAGYGLAQAAEAAEDSIADAATRYWHGTRRGAEAVVDVGGDFVGGVGHGARVAGGGVAYLAGKTRSGVEAVVDVGGDFVGGVGHGARVAGGGVAYLAGEVGDFGGDVFGGGKGGLNNLVDFFGGSGGQVSSLGEFCAFGPSLQDGSASFQLAPR